MNKNIILCLMVTVFILSCSKKEKSKKDIWLQQPKEIKYSKEKEKEIWGKVLRGKDPEIFYGTPLYKTAISIKRGDKKEVINSISKLTKEEINYQEPKFKSTIGHYAISVENSDMLVPLIDKGLNCNLMSANGGSLITNIITSRSKIDNYEMQSYNILKYIIEKGNANVNLLNTRKNTFNRTPLIRASKYNLEKVKLLVANGADPNFVYKDSSNDLFPESALISALQYGRIDIIEYLIYDLNVDYKSLRYPSEDKFSPNGYQVLRYLRAMTYKIGSEKHKKKMKLVKFLSEQGLDYWKTEIPNNILRNKNYTKEYLKKY
jgi:hypothetical protein